MCFFFVCVLPKFSFILYTLFSTNGGFKSESCFQIFLLNYMEKAPVKWKTLQWALDWTLGTGILEERGSASTWSTWSMLPVLHCLTPDSLQTLLKTSARMGEAVPWLFPDTKYLCHTVWTTCTQSKDTLCVCSSMEQDKVAMWKNLPTCVGDCLPLELGSAAFLKTYLLKAPSQFLQVRCLC